MPALLALDGADAVARARDELNAKQADADAARAAVKDLKAQLDRCREQNTYWKGDH